MNRISKTDVDDREFVDAFELASDGYTNPYRLLTLVSTTSSTQQITASTPTDIDWIDNIDDPLQEGDVVEVFGNLAAGRYLINSIVNHSTFSVLEPILDSSDGYAYCYHPSGASKVGYNPTSSSIITSTDVQGALDELDEYVSTQLAPVPTGIGQVLFAIEDYRFRIAMPVTSNQGWLVNDQGILLVNPADGYG